VADPAVIADYLQSPPTSALEAGADSDAYAQESDGRGVDQTPTQIGSGLTLFPDPQVCNDFNRRAQWSIAKTGIWTAHYGGWGPFAVDDDYYHSANVVFAQERSIGPGQRYANSQSALKIASSQPYAAGVGSPLIGLRPGETITVSVKYLIFDHGSTSSALDWASMGVKPDATGGGAEYVNGYHRGQWAELSHIVTVGKTGQIMILLQAQSPAALNSNIYFDDVKIQRKDRYVRRCW